MTEDKRNDMLRKLKKLKLPGLTQALVQQHDDEPSFVDMPFDERLALLVDAELNLRSERRTQRLAKHADLPIPQASFTALDESPERSLNRRTLNTLRSNDYVRQSHNVIITGAAGSGKTYISSMLGNKACADGFKVRYVTAEELYATLGADHDTSDLDAAIARDILRADLIIVDEFLLAVPTESELHAVYKLLVDRSHRRSIIICSHYMFESWYDRMNGGVLVESILDRLRNSAYVLPIASTISMREKYEGLVQTGSDKTRDE